MDWLKEITRETRGKVAVLAAGLLLGSLVVAIDFFATGAIQHARFAIAQSTATTTVTVLNTAPNWTVDAQEALESSTSSPTDAGNDVLWNGIATDPNSDNYYLLICKTSSTPTAGVGGGANGGTGGTTSFGSHLSATGGGAGVTGMSTTAYGGMVAKVRRSGADDAAIAESSVWERVAKQFRPSM